MMHSKFLLTFTLLLLLSSTYATDYYSITNGIFESDGTWSTTGYDGVSSGSNPGCTMTGNTAIYIQDSITSNCGPVFFKGNTDIIIENGGVLIVNGDLDIAGNAELSISSNTTVIVTGDLNIAGSGIVNLDGSLYVGGDVILQGNADVCGNGSADIQGDISGESWCFGIQVLPVELLDFTATLENENDVLLQWQTASEKDNDYFILERSTNGLSFDKIGEITGAGSTNNENSYEFLDQFLDFGNFYYRLSQVDFDGKTETFEIIAISLEKNSSGACELKVYPNPCVPNCRAVLNDCPEGHYQTYLMDGYGNMVSQLIPSSSGGNKTEYYIDKQNYMMPGVYIIKSAKGNTQLSKKIMIK